MNTTLLVFILQITKRTVNILHCKCDRVISYVMGLFRMLMGYFLFYGAFFTWSCFKCKIYRIILHCKCAVLFRMLWGLIHFRAFYIANVTMSFHMSLGLFHLKLYEYKIYKFILDCKCDRVISVISYVMGFFSRGVVLSTKYIGYKNMLHNAHWLIKWY